MARKYTKMEILAEEVFRRKEAGETNRQIAESYGLTKYQIKQLVARQNRKKRAIAIGTLKCECLNRMQFANRDEVKAAVAEYIQFYNFERINMKNGLTPDEIRSKAA